MFSVFVIAVEKLTSDFFACRLWGETNGCSAGGAVASLAHIGVASEIPETLRSSCRPLNSNDVRQTIVEDLVLALNYVRMWSYIPPEDC